MMMYFNSFLLFTNLEYCAWYIQLAFDGFLDSDCDVPSIFGLKSLLSFLVRFDNVQSDSGLNYLCPVSLLFLKFVQLSCCNEGFYGICVCFCWSIDVWCVSSCVLGFEVGDAKFDLLKSIE